MDVTEVAKILLSSKYKMSKQASDKAVKIFLILFLGFLGYAITFGILMILFNILNVNAWYGIYIPIISLVGVVIPIIFLNKKILNS